MICPGEKEIDLLSVRSHNEGTTHWEHPEIAWVFKDIGELDALIA